MPGEQQTEQKPNDETESADAAEAAAQARINAIVNKAITGHMARFESKIGATFESTISKALEGFKPKQPAADDADKGTAQPKQDPAVKLLQEKYERLEAQSKAAEARAAAVEERARKDAVRASLSRDLVDVAKVRAGVVPAVVAMLEAQGAVRFDPETGAASLVVKRSRAKNAKAEELAFDDLKEGIRDWASSPEAADFIASPEQTKRSTQTTQQQSGPRRAGTTATYDKPAVTEDEMARRTLESLTSRGIDPNAALKG